jgi:fumarylacetoacetate (FAA) hydrolase
MKLATLRNAAPDGQLVVVSRDLQRAVPATGIASSLLSALETWEQTEPRLRALAERLDRGDIDGALEFSTGRVGPPLPRTWQWLDASAFHSHGDLMERAFKHAPIEGKLTRPLMYQGGSDDFLGPWEDMPLPTEADGIDFEAEIAIVVDRVPMGTPAAEALRARDARQRRQPARARDRRDENRFRMDPREARHELQPRGRDTR